MTLMVARRRRVLAAITSLGLLAGCGRRGPLELPKATATAPPAAQPREDE